MEEFELTDDDCCAIEIAKNVARSFLKHPKITPQQVIGLGNALYALERLPIVTPGSFCEFGIECRAGTEEFSEMRYITFRISDSSFGISRGGSQYSSAVGSDSYSEPGWEIEVDGYRETGADLSDIEDSIAEYLNLGAKITVDDESQIEYGRTECHLIEHAKTKKLTADALKKQTSLHEWILESDHFDVAIEKCRDCGQLYLYCFREYNRPSGDDDYWTFWVPISEDEIPTVKAANPLMKFMGEFLNQRPHICWHPDGQVFWAEKGFPLAFVVFLP